MNKYKYIKYDYNKIIKSSTNNESKIPHFQNVCVKTIGFNLVPNYPMSEPSKQIYFAKPTNENILQRITEVSNEIERRSSKGRANSFVVGSVTSEYFKKINFFKKINNIKHGKKI